MTQEDHNQKYPLHAKLRENLSRATELGAFLDFLNSKGVFYREIDQVCERHFAGLIGEYLGIDAQELEREKDQMYEEFLSKTP